MSFTHLKSDHSERAQKVAAFTGEGAYHGSTRKRTAAAKPVTGAPALVVEEMRARTLEAYPLDGSRSIADFEATFPNVYKVE